MHHSPSPLRPNRLSLAGLLLGCTLLLLCSVALAEQSGQTLELSRPVRSWEFVSAVGTRAAVFGNEQGTLEAWVYPLKVVRKFHLLFHIAGTTLPAAALARTLVVHPESITIVYTGDVFSVR
jgi:hypothetical protein